VKQVAKNSNGLPKILDYITNRREMLDRSALAVSSIGQNELPDTHYLCKAALMSVGWVVV
jgi:hypothetical protein